MAVRVAVVVSDHDADHDTLKTQRIDEPSARYEVRDHRASFADRLSFADGHGPDASALAPPVLGLDKLQRERTRSIVRRASTRHRKLEDAPDSLRLESTRRRSSVAAKEPSRATVVYSPRALTELLTRKKAATRSEWGSRCCLM